MSTTEVFANGSMKRKFEDADEHEAENRKCITLKDNKFLDASKNTHLQDKKQATEGFSWWTCLQLGMPLSKSKPQPRKY